MSTTPDDVEVRPATREDVAAVADVAEAAWYAAYAGFVGDETIREGLSAGYAGDRLREVIERDAVDFLVADDGGVVGFASATREWSDEVRLRTLYVDPDRWDEGVGTALLEGILNRARERDADRVRASAFVDNHAGTAFLEAGGFEAVDTVDTSFGDEVHRERVYAREV
jgi:N-acetylglutamate synthase-like GNAT family acetyltransferase